jgi:hypothetical protein
VGEVALDETLADVDGIEVGVEVGAAELHSQLDHDLLELLSDVVGSFNGSVI